MDKLWMVLVKLEQAVWKEKVRTNRMALGK